MSSNRGKNYAPTVIPPPRKYISKAAYKKGRQYVNSRIQKLMLDNSNVSGQLISVDVHLVRRSDFLKGGVHLSRRLTGIYSERVMASIRKSLVETV